MKYLLRNFLGLFRHFTSSTLINFIGLTAALVIFYVVLLQVYYDFTYDKGYTEYKNIVQFTIYDKEDGAVGTHTNVQFPRKMFDIIPEVKQYALLQHWAHLKFDIIDNDGSINTYTIPSTAVTQGFCRVFHPEIISGDTTAIFTTWGNAMISENTAKAMFGNENPIGKTIKFHYGQGQLTVQAVYRDFPENSSLENGIYMQMTEEQPESEWSFQAYFLVTPTNIGTVNEKINTEEIIGKKRLESMERNEWSSYYKVSSLNDIYLYGYGEGGAKRIHSVISLLTIGILTLLIAFVNFVNLALAMIPSRVKTINVHKILGIGKKTLRFGIAMESVLLTCISIGIALFLVHFFKNTTFAEQMFTTSFSLRAHADLLILVSFGIIILTFLIGLYTSYYTTSVNVTEVLKGAFSLGIKGAKLRNLLIVIQFTSAIVLIVVSLFIRRQHDYMINYDWGLPKENIIYLPLVDLGNKANTFGEELLKDPRIVDYSISRVIPGESTMSWGRKFEGKQINLTVWSVDDRFFNFFDIDIIAGEKPRHMDSIVAQIVLNQTFLERYGFDESIVGKDFPAFGPGRVVAIAKDVNFETLYSPIEPMAFGVLAKWNNFKYFLVKISGNDVRGAIDNISTTWKEFSKEPFNPRFLDKHMEELYTRENNMAKLIGAFGFIVAIIAVMGVYGLIIYNTRYKRKEIGIRKVNGATVWDIVLLLNRNLLILLLISFVIAIPVGWYIINRWLEYFAFKTSLPIWLFPLAGILVLIVSVLAVSWQSIKAAMTNPVEVLKSSE